MKDSDHVTLSEQESSEFGSSSHSGAMWVIWCLAVALAIATAVQCHTGDARAIANPKWAPSLLYGGVLWFWWAAIGTLLGRAARRWPQYWYISRTNAAIQLLVGVVLSLPHVELLRETNQFMILKWPYLRTIGYDKLVFYDAWRFGFETLFYTVLWGTSAAILTQMARQRESLQTAELKQQLSQAHLRALQMQMEPHFMLNTLNAITALVEDGSQKEAVETLAHLNAILKLTLVRETPEKVSLAQELALVEHYLAIEQIRFADRLRVEMSVDPEALNSMIPCFLLQPIVENAIRHGIAPLKAKGMIRASVEREGEVLHLAVRDNGPGIANKLHRGHGIGLRNTVDRLTHFYAGNYEFSSGEVQTGGFEVLITIPYERMLA